MSPTTSLVRIVVLGALLALSAASFAAEPAAGPAEVAHFSKLLPFLPEVPSGWAADKPEGSTMDSGAMKITNVHRDYTKEGADNAPTVAISILDSGANKEYVEATTAAWTFTNETADGYSKSVNLDGNPGFETYDKENKSGSLWVMVGKRFFLTVETRGLEPNELQEWVRRIDLKKLAEVK